MFALYVVDKMRFQMIGWSAVEVNIESKRFTVVCFQREISRCYFANCVEEMNLSACRTCSTVTLPHSTNHITVLEMAITVFKKSEWVSLVFPKNANISLKAEMRTSSLF